MRSATLFGFSIAAVLAAAAACSGCKASAPASAREAGAAGDAMASDGGFDAGFDAAGPLAVNERFVKRYEDETAIDHVAQTVATSTASVFSAFPKGDIVATVKEGQGTVQIAERNGYELVTFPDPSLDPAAPPRTLMGWVAKYVYGGLDAGPPGSKITAPWCSGTKVLVLQGDAPRCDYVCYADRECRDGATCEAAMELPKTGDVAGTATYTTVCTPPPGAKPGKRDGGVPSLFGAAHNVDGKCPTGFAAAPKLGALCFMTCKTDVNCPEDATCKSAPSAKEKLCFAN